jgi:hypothetical protein
MECKFAAAERKGGRRPGLGHAWLSWGAALAAAMVLIPSAGICGQQNSLRTSLQATLTVDSDSGSLSIARVAVDGATGQSKSFAVVPSCSPSCVVYMDRDPGLRGSSRNSPGSLEGTPESLLVTPETDKARLALPAGSDRNAATVLIYF